MGLKFFEKTRNLIDELELEQQSEIKEAAEIISNSIMRRGILQAFGSGHSYAAALEVCGRAGGLIPSKVIGSHFVGDYESLEGVGTLLMRKVDLKENDAIIIISNSGKNPLPIEIAEAVKKNGNKLIVLTSLEVSKKSVSNHSSGKLLYEYADVILDNHSVYGDASLEIAGVSQKVCGTSSVASTLLLQQTIYETAKLMANQNYDPPIYKSANIEGGLEYNQAIENQYADRIFHL